MRPGFRIFLTLMLVLPLTGRPSAPKGQDDKRALGSLSTTELKAKAEAGDLKAMANLRNRYEWGVGVPQDYAEAMVWARKAAELGDAEAQLSVGSYYAEGHGVPVPSAIEAVKWYRKAAHQGWGMALYRMGDSYENGNGVPQNPPIAASWYIRAAWGSAAWPAAAAQYRLGILYTLGQGVGQNLPEGYVWFSLAVANGHENARGPKDEAAKRLSPAALQQAQVRVQTLQQQMKALHTQP